MRRPLQPLSPQDGHTGVAVHNPSSMCASPHTKRRCWNHSSSSSSRSRVRTTRKEGYRPAAAGYCVDLLQDTVWTYCRILCGPTAGDCVDLLPEIVWTYCRILCGPTTGQWVKSHSFYCIAAAVFFCSPGMTLSCFSFYSSFWSDLGPFFLPGTGSL